MLEVPPPTRLWGASEHSLWRISTPAGLRFFDHDVKGVGDEGHLRPEWWGPEVMPARPRGRVGDEQVLRRPVAPMLAAPVDVVLDVAAQLLTTAGDNPDRLHSEAALAHLCGAAPIPASSGRVRRHRLHRGGDRGANHALHTIALCRLRYDQRTRAYLHRRTTEGLSKQEILRCLKRYIVRDIYTALRADFAALAP